MNIVEDFISLFFPRFCVSCRRSLYKAERMICTHCLTDVAKTGSHKESPNFIEQKFHGRVALTSACSYLYFQQDGIAQQLLHHLKYKNLPQLGVEMGQRYGAELSNYIVDKQIDFIVPVPLHYKKLKKRGYNQSAQIATGLSEVTGIPMLDALKRIKSTTTQTAKNRVERWKNVSQIFEISNPKINQKRILLVDDVITTGATIEACAQVLLDADCQVAVLSLAAAK